MVQFILTSVTMSCRVGPLLLMYCMSYEEVCSLKRWLRIRLYQLLWFNRIQLGSVNLSRSMWENEKAKTKNKRVVAQHFLECEATLDVYRAVSFFKLWNEQNMKKGFRRFHSSSSVQLQLCPRIDFHIKCITGQPRSSLSAHGNLNLLCATASRSISTFNSRHVSLEESFNVQSSG